jgi:hypothetical protein
MRKMMSLIIEDLQPTEDHPRFFLFSKGADSTIMSKLASPSMYGSAERARARAEVIRLTDSQLRCVGGWEVGGGMGMGDGDGGWEGGG